MSTITLPNTLMRSELKLPGVIDVYRGKVRDVYHLEGDMIVMVASDRLSAFDVVMPRGIPHKGQTLTEISWEMLRTSTVPQWAMHSPDPCVIVGVRTTPIKVEMVVRDRLTGSWWRKYQQGIREIGGYKLRDGMKEFDRFENDGPIITPSTKADEGHDEDISPDEIITQGLCTGDQWDKMCLYSLELFREGTRIALQRKLVLVDTKYEFGLDPTGNVILIDEINTPDSSRYFHHEGFDVAIADGKTPKHLSKEFVRQWLISQGFQGKEGQKMPELTDGWVMLVSERYAELFGCIMGKPFEPASTEDINGRIQRNLNEYFNSMRG